MHSSPIRTVALTAAALVSFASAQAGPLFGGEPSANVDYLIGATPDMLQGTEPTERQAQDAIARALGSPATAEDVTGVDTADLNDDSFVTLDEVIALSNAGLDDDDMLARLAATEQVFNVSQAQARALVDSGVSPAVVKRLESINAGQRQRLRR